MIDTGWIDVVLLAFLVAITFAIIRLRDLFGAVMLTGIFSLLSAGLFMVMDAVDVAFTEAAVGAGISTILMLRTLALTEERSKPRFNRFEIIPFTVVLATGVALIYGTFDMPRYGDPQAPVHTQMAKRFVEQSGAEVGVPNIVTSVLASYRGYDTFGETTVIFTAAVGVFLLLGAPRGGRRGEDALRNDIVLRISAKALIPFIMVFALYVQFHGDYGPGGGFQAGVIFAAAIVLYTLVFGLSRAEKVFRRRPLELLVAGGVLLYGSVGLESMLMGGNFLDYNVLADDPIHGQHLGILLIELGVGVTVAAVMVALFFLFVRQRQT